MKFIKLFFGIMILFFYSGCNMIGLNNIVQTSKQVPCWIKNPGCVKNKYPYSSIGSGQTINEATNNALTQLAKQKEIDIYIKEIEKSKDIIKDKKRNYSDKIVSDISLKTSVKIKYWKIIDRYKINKRVHVLISLDTKMIDNLYYLSILKSIIDITQNDFYKIDNFRDLEDLKTLIYKGEKLLEKIDFNLLNHNKNLKDYENSVFFEHKLKIIKNSIEQAINDYNIFKNKSRKQQEAIFQKIKQQLKNDIPRNCLSIREKYNININYDNGCKIYLDNNKTKICKSFCGGNPYIILDNKINLSDLSLLKNIRIIDKQLFEDKRKLLILKNLIRK